MANVTEKPINIGGRQTTIGEVWQSCGQNDQHPDYIRALHQLLWEQRLKAMPYEISPNVSFDAEMEIEPFMIGAVVRSASGQFYAGANTHMSKDQASNDCAEAIAMNVAFSAEGRGVVIKEVNVMGGKAVAKGGVSIDQPIAPDYIAAHITPCGHCRDRIDNVSPRQDPIKVRVFPLLPLDEQLLAYHRGAAPDERPLMVRDYVSIDELLPYRELQISGQKADFQDGIDYLRREPKEENAHKKVMRPGRVSGLKRDEQLLQREYEPKNKAYLLRSIHERLMKTIRAEIHSSHRQSLSLENFDQHLITLAVVRTHDGEYYCGSYYESGDRQAMPHSIENAIQNAGGNRTITDVFVLQVDMKQLTQQLASEGDALSLSMPKGATVQFVFKARSNARNAAGELEDKSPFKDSGKAAPRIHLFSLVPPTKGRFDAQKHMHSFSVHDLCPDMSVSPKAPHALKPQPRVEERSGVGTIRVNARGL